MKFASKTGALQLFLAARTRMDSILMDAATDVSDREFEDNADYFARVFEEAARRVREHMTNTNKDKETNHVND